jgi:hypothetical protein
MLGVVLGFLDMFIPIQILGLPPIAVFSFRIMGLFFICISAFILMARLQQTGAYLFADVPSKNHVILLHSRRGKNPNAVFLKGILMDLEFIRSKNKIFKDTGGGTRICGHDVRFTHETIAHDIPLWLGEYLHKIKTRYNIHNHEELRDLYKQLKELKQPIPGVMSLEDQLNQIVELQNILKNPERKQSLLKLSVEDLHHMAETLVDGQTIHMEDAESFIESATPNELDSLMTQDAAHQFLRFKGYRDPGDINFAKWIPLMMMLMIGAALAFSIIYGTFQ